MNHRKTTSRWRRVPLVLFPLILVAATASSASAAAAPSGLVPPGGTFAGKTYGQWSASWWQWAVSMPASHSALADPTGANCALNQSGRVFMLAGVASAAPPFTAERTCHVPAGVALMVPIINNECSSSPQDCGASTDYNTLLAAAAGGLNGATTKVKLDGVALHAVLAVSPAPPFPLDWVAGNPFGIDPGPTVSVADGFYVLLRPLTPGHHRLAFTGSEPGFTVSVLYHLDVAG